MDAPPFHLIGRPGKSRYVLVSQFNLCVLCVSVVCFCSEFINHRDTENTEVAQRRVVSGGSARRAEGHTHLVSVELVHFFDRARNLVDYLAISPAFYDRIYDPADRGSLEECA